MKCLLIQRFCIEKRTISHEVVRHRILTLQYYTMAYCSMQTSLHQARLWSHKGTYKTYYKHTCYNISSSNRNVTLALKCNMQGNVMARESCQNYGNRSTAFYTQATALGIPLNWVCPHNRVNTTALLGKYLEIVYILKLSIYISPH